MGCARAAGFEDLSIDLIFGVPGQTPADLEADLAEALALGPGPRLLVRARDQAGLGARAARAAGASTRTRAPTPTGASSQGLEDAGYRWYETANFARPGHECRHSLAYWGAADYLGIGVGAVSTVGRPALAQRAEPGGLPRTRSPAARSRRARASRSTTTTCAASAGCSACGWRDGLDLGWAGPPDHPEALGAPGARPGLLGRERRRRRPHPRGPLRAERRSCTSSWSTRDDRRRPRALKPRQELILRTVVEEHIASGHAGRQQEHRRPRGHRLRLLDRALRAGAPGGARASSTTRTPRRAASPPTGATATTSTRCSPATRRRSRRRWSRPRST